jgi:hypothetical protein
MLPKVRPGTIELEFPETHAIHLSVGAHAQECGSETVAICRWPAPPSIATTNSASPRARTICLPSGAQAAERIAPDAMRREVPPSADARNAPAGVR